MPQRFISFFMGICSGDQIPLLGFFQKALDAFIICCGDGSVGKAFLLLTFWIRVLDVKY